MACDYTNLHLVNFLLEQPKALATLNEPEEEYYGYSRYDCPIHVACEANSLEIVKRLLEVGVDLEARDLSGDTALHRAAFSHKGLDVFLHLCTIEGIDINAKNRINTSLLSQAVSCPNDVIVIKKLLEMGADTTNVDAHGRTVFHHACSYGSLEVFKMLLDRCDVNEKDTKGNSPLHWLVKRSYSSGLGGVTLEKLNLLLKAPGLDKSATNISGETALHVACLEGSIQVVEILLNTEGIDKFALDSNNESILHKSARRGDWNLYQKLINEYKFDPKIKTKDGRGIIHLLCEHNHAVFFDDYILEFYKEDAKSQVVSSKPQRLSRKKKTSKSRKSAAESVAKFTEMIKSVDEKGWTPLHYACDKGSFDIIARLFDFGVDFNKKDLQGKSPMDIAETRGNLNGIIDIFEENQLNKKMEDVGFGEYEIPYELQGYDLSNDDGYYWTGKEGFDSNEQYYRYIDSLNRFR